VIPRTFSLARLLVAIALIAVICGLAVNFPALFNPFTALFLAPAAVTILVLSSFAKYGALSIFNAFIGAIFGFAAMPLAGPSPTSLCCVDAASDWALVFPALGASLLGGIFLLAEKLDARSALTNPKSQL
jgi:hypothetical protein